MPWIETEDGIILPWPAIGSTRTTVITKFDSNENGNGNTIGSLRGDDKLNITVQLPNLTPEELKGVLSLWDRNNGGAYVRNFRVLNPVTNEFEIRRFRVGNRNASPLAVNKQSDRPDKWTGISIVLEEM